MKIKTFLIILISSSMLLAISPAGYSFMGDIVLDRYFKNGGKLPPPKFPHWFHRIRFKCKVCHPAIFKMKKGENDITMDKIMKGEFCGKCHDGTTAWQVSFDACPRCHTKQASDATAIANLPKDNQGQLDWVASITNNQINPKDAIDPKAKTGTPFRLNLQYKGKNMPDAIFPHYAHTLWLDCNNCHIDIFLMKAGQSKMTMEGIFAGKFCAECHGKVAFPIDNCTRCHKSAP
jgi:c(7)-type cytochrome triheme protein